MMSNTHPDFSSLQDYQKYRNTKANNLLQHQKGATCQNCILTTLTSCRSSSPAKSISVDHTLKVGKPIGGHREQDNKNIKSYKKLLIVLNEEGAVVAWELTNSTSQDEIEPVLNEVKFKLKNNPISYIYTDTCCGFKKVYEQCLPGVPIKLDLFHATQRITKSLPDKKSREAIDFSHCFGLVLRNTFDTGDTRNQITEDPATITRNIDDFMKLKDTYIKELPVNKRNDLLSEIENLKKHVEKGCVSGIPSGGGTENNERLHRYLNRSFLRGATCLSVEVAKAVLTVLFYVYNSRIINGKKGKVAFYTPLTLQKASTDAQFKKSIDFTENEKNSKTETDYIVEICQSVMQLCNAIQSVRGKCFRRGFLAEDLLKFTSFPERPLNINSHEENLCRNLAAFQLKIDPVAPDEDCLSASILLQLAKHYSQFPNEACRVQNHFHTIGLADSMEGNILKLR